MFKKPAFYGVANVGIIIYKTNPKTLIFKCILYAQRLVYFLCKFCVICT